MVRSEAQKKDEHCKQPVPINKSRYWQVVLWNENLIKDWEEKIGEILQLPYAYCVHDKDKESDGSPRKLHTHLIVVHPNTTTYKHALNIFKLLGTEACNTCQAVLNIRFAYDYLIHDTEDCKKKKKFLYEPSERAIGNNFDIGIYEQIGAKEKLDMAKEIADFIIGNNIENIADLYILLTSNFEPKYLEIFSSKNAMFERLCRGLYLKNHPKK